MESRPNPPTPFPNREGGESGAAFSDRREDSDPRSPPSILGKGVGGLGPSSSASSRTVAASHLAVFRHGFANACERFRQIDRGVDAFKQTEDRGPVGGEAVR